MFPRLSGCLLVCLLMLDQRDEKSLCEGESDSKSHDAFLVAIVNRTDQPTVPRTREHWAQAIAFQCGAGLRGCQPLPSLTFSLVCSWASLCLFVLCRCVVCSAEPVGDYLFVCTFAEQEKDKDEDSEGSISMASPSSCTMHRTCLPCVCMETD